MVLHLGLGERSAPVDIEILWPGEKRQAVKGVEVDRLVEYRLESAR